MFAVIRVFQDYDYVEGAECVAAFPTEEDANALIQELISKQNTANKARIAYIKEWVDKIEIPENPDMDGWRAFLETYLPVGCLHVLPQDFKKYLDGYLWNHSPKLEGYDPPPRGSGGDNLFAVEIK